MSPHASGRSPELFCGKDLAVTEREFDEYWMRAALREASKAAEDGEVPTGCMIVEPGPEAAEGEWTPSTARILARAHNQTEGLVDATAHAEMLALSSAFAVKGNWRLAGCRLYVTKEPCPMCAGAIVLSRPDAVVWGVGDPKRGGSTVFDIFRHPGVNHHPEIVEGVLEQECLSVLRNFFRARRADARRGADADAACNRD
jgi:tRNA(adenine34) deaminase